MKLIAEGDNLTIKLEGFEILASLRRRVSIPREKILSMAFEPEFSTSERELRLGGTGLPGILYAGNFRGNGNWYFLYLRKPRGYPLAGSLRAKNVLSLELKDYTYKEIWLTCRPDIAENLLGWWKS